jgi:hypothetical protein
MASRLKILIIMGILLAATVVIQARAVAEEDCSSCHKVRHGDAQCLNCHWNASMVSGKHTQKPFVPTSIHSGFDWEADDSNDTNLPPDQESCPACHVNLKEHTSQIVNTCEGCHVEGKYLVASTILLRSDVTNRTPRVYSHYSNSTISVPPQGGLSSCFGFNTSTGEGSCHGVGFTYKDRSGGYFAFNLNYTDVAIRSDVYHWTTSVDNLPQSNDCTFCHRQEDAVIRKAWGNAKPLPSDSSHKDATDKDCLSCHVEGQFRSFHGKEVVRIVEKSYMANILIISLLILIVTVIFLWRKQR